MRQLINMKQTDCLHESQVTGVCVCTFANNEQIISNKKPSNRRKSHLYIQVFDTHLFKKDVHHLPSTKNKSYSEFCWFSLLRWFQWTYFYWFACRRQNYLHRFRHHVKECHFCWIWQINSHIGSIRINFPRKPHSSFIDPIKRSFNKMESMQHFLSFTHRDEQKYKIN